MLDRSEVSNEEAGAEGAFVHLVDNDNAVAQEEQVAEQVVHRHAIHDILDMRIARGCLIKVHQVPNVHVNRVCCSLSMCAMREVAATLCGWVTAIILSFASPALK